ncbi:Uncharacterized protein FWK35_00039159 [Aphis craccivora]|uniref:Uncharacterized protein n=1 Tax=Aphis craccivora TaxID=307492 RepID=A0A6G0VSC3_APHCR|nr:Uncharacterized protein FWK35_00039159 [Aphis craccivora]
MNVLIFCDVFFYVSVYSIICQYNASISNCRSGFRWQSPWCVIEVKSKH